MRLLNGRAFCTTCDVITVYLDIDGILCSKLKNNVVSLGANLVVKWSIITIIDQGPISRLNP